MKSMAITDFKAHALKVIDGISKNHEPVIITKRGKPMAKLIPFDSNEKENIPDKLKNMVIEMGDVETPLGSEMWDSAQ